MKQLAAKIKENFTVHVPSLVIGLILGVTTGTFILDLVGFGGVAQKIVERECGAAESVRVDGANSPQTFVAMVPAKYISGMAQADLDKIKSSATLEADSFWPYE